MASLAGLRVLIADDHPMIIDSLKRLFESNDIAVVSTAAGDGSARKLFEESKPDVVVLDIRFETGPTGLEIAKDLLREFPQAKIVFFSQFDDDFHISEAYRIGGKGFVTKREFPETLVSAVRQVFEGKTFFLPEISARLVLLGLQGGPSPLTKLENRELEVFRLMAVGRTNVEIAQAMDLSTKTISLTSQLIKQKLGIHRQADITHLALKYKLIEL